MPQLSTLSEATDINPEKDCAERDTFAYPDLNEDSNWVLGLRRIFV